MANRVERAGLQVDAALAEFIEQDVLDTLGRDAGDFWQGFAGLLAEFMPRNAALLKRRDALQATIDDWHEQRAGKPHDGPEYEAFLSEIGYLVPEPDPFAIGTENVDAEIATRAGPQLVVPVLNARFLLNAANARWGSLYDALYGTDALDAPPAKQGGYDPDRGAAVIAAAKAFLDDALPLESGSWTELTGKPSLRNGACYCGETETGSWVFCHNGLHIIVDIDRDHPIGRDDPAGVSDVRLESALTTIVDLEDSVAAVDASDKLRAYRNWLGVICGNLTASFEKGGKTVTRDLDSDIEYKATNHKLVTMQGRSVLFVRNVGHLMASDAVLTADGDPVPEGVLDAVVSSAIGAFDIEGHVRWRNSIHGSVYIVKPKMHGPEECAFTNDLFDAVEDLLGLKRHAIKVGVMDEERRTSANLAACIHAVKDRVVFINTGFLDRTGDEIHTSMKAGAMQRKAEIKASTWLQAYEKRNVAIGLACGLKGKAQIGKGMWAAPDRMAAMMEEKGAHLEAGANCAWVPSPTAATLHAMHYHRFDVSERQEQLAQEPVPPLSDLLTIPLADGANWSDEEVQAELDNNAQGILGYVVRWIDAGVGCSKVPDIHDVGLMEDRATLRISSQHIANWLMHGVVSADQVDASLARMAAKVDAQNEGDPSYTPLIGNEDGPAYQAARDLIFKGAEQPNGYTEPLLHAWRRRAKGE
ncbi:malate synthase G [Pseudoblastomonas halimionae]|uniref:Malate synthase G n=1 Tax=Alteriqipengyuania halimionae TaxID=1926630 RepID=A0A6I4U3E4_9SPHN|nr:malate synthase G [Alteriqipengyuania halimionae]MXP09012.1 malate synthase G [Alteriqipengyuania halimionae]